MNNALTLTAILPSLLVSFIATAAVTPFCIVLLKKVGLLDDPKRHKHPAAIHTKPIPRGGGIPLFIGVVVASAFFLPITKVTLALLVSSTIALLVGIFDDKKDLSPYLRFLTNILVGVIVVGSGVTMSFITNPLGGILSLNAVHIFSFPLSDLLAILWIVWVMNMLNWSKGVDGQMPGIVAISAIVIGMLSLRFGGTEEVRLAANLSFIIAGASLGFLLFNFYPARIFPGYGATFLYLLLAVASILSGAKLATAILVMGVPMVDGIVTVLRRILTGRSPFWHDNKHLHHLLLRLGMKQRTIALFYWTISAILGSISLHLSSKGKLFAITMLVAILGGALLFLHLALSSADEKKNR